MAPKRSAYMDVGWSVPDMKIDPADPEMTSDETTDGSNRQLVTLPSSPNTSKTRAMASDFSKRTTASRKDSSL